MYGSPALVVTPLLLWILLMVGILISSGAKDNYLQVPESAIGPLIAEMNFYRNTSHIIKARLEAEATAEKQRASSAQVRLEVKQQKAFTDTVIKQIGVLQTQKKNLQSNTSALGKILLFR